ncbi:molybdopterin molybdotransferase MoeA [Helicobacter sp. MIT 05-5294]|uniref:molybdopterin molybdotransferase MoeA n=1 Tax=Helicobacter sp. MIT 05-5294 TaxID=1548150 RepID=UPI0010FD302F|nr:molybdopterin molybdotransferase MoeA [Helicobacter sp. MIT 05-5294]TLD88601.1 molybdopterin molybdenumtransferase MoeA [Helicobacter sp. MIT 05-5294]
MKTKISYEEAKEILESQNIAPLSKERVFLHESLGRVLAEDIFATQDMPEVACSNMDGYAVYSKFLGLQTPFVILEENPAGNAKECVLPLDAPYAIKTFTGARIPQNADVLVPLEQVQVETKAQSQTLHLLEIPKVGQYIREKGAHYKKGENLLAKGMRLNANHIGLLASLNRVFVEVYERAKVGILVSGNELLEIGENAHDGANIYNANGHLLVAKVLECGGIPKLYPILKDQKEQVENRVSLALQECDLVVSSGGASVGDYDFITAFCKEHTSEVVFKGVSIKPGQHISYAHFGGKQFFGLPGFPNSTLVTFELFVKEILLRLNGTHLRQIMLEIPLVQDVSKTDSRLEFRVCNVRNIKGKWTMDFEGKKDFQSAILNNFCPLDFAYNGLCILENAKKAGELVQVILL